MKIIVTPHGDGQDEGVVRQVIDGALGIEFDSMPGMVHHWYVPSEVMVVTETVEGTKKPNAAMEMSASTIKTEARFEVVKLDEQRHRVTGFAMISCNKNGEPVYDLQGDHISPDELVKAVQDFASIVGEYRVDDMHDRSDTGRVVESMVLTAELQKSLSIPEGTQPIGWLVTVEVPKAEFELVKAGKRPMFSIEARAQRVAA